MTGARAEARGRGDNSREKANPLHHPPDGRWSPSPAGEGFGAVALHLAGLAGWHLGWCPDRFWRSTPAEMEAVVRVMLGADDPAAGTAPPTREAIARLQEMYPDG